MKTIHGVWVAFSDYSHSTRHEYAKKNRKCKVTGKFTNIYTQMKGCAPTAYCNIVSEREGVAGQIHKSQRGHI